MDKNAKRTFRNKKAIFIIEKEMINNYFNGQATKLGRKWEKLLLSLEKSSFVSYELLMNNGTFLIKDN